MPELLLQSPAGAAEPRPRLSVVTATYRRPAELSALMESLGEQLEGLEELVEYVVVDNASEDGTVEVVRAFAERHPALPLRLYAQSTNVGMDRNVFDAFRAARGRYVWFIADDDEIAPGRLPRILDFLASNEPPIMIVRANNVGEWDVLPSRGSEGRVEWFDPGDPDWAPTLFATPFLAALVFRRDALHEHLESAEPLIGTCYAHWVVTLRLLSRAASVPYFDDVCLLGNKNFNGVSRFPNYEVLVKGRVRAWDLGASGRVRESLRGMMEQHALSAWRSAAAGSMRVGETRGDLWTEYGESFGLLGARMLRGLPWVLTATALPKTLRRTLDRFRVRTLRGGRHGESIG